MERHRKQDDRESTGILQIAAIGAVIGLLFWGGLKLLGQTHVAHDTRQAERKAYADSIQKAMKNAEAINTERDRQEMLASIRAEREAAAKRKQETARDDRLRCINGQLFRRLENGWESVTTNNRPTPCPT